MKPENAVPSRMSLQLRRALITIGLVAALLSVLVAAILFHRAFAAQVDQDLAARPRLWRRPARAPWPKPTGFTGQLSG